MGEQNWGLSVVKITEKVMTQQQNKQSCAFQWARTKKMGIVQPRVVMAGLPGLAGCASQPTPARQQRLLSIWPENDEVNLICYSA